MFHRCGTILPFGTLNTSYLSFNALNEVIIRWWGKHLDEKMLHIGTQPFFLTSFGYGYGIFKEKNLETLPNESINTLGSKLWGFHSKTITLYYTAFPTSNYLADSHGILVIPCVKPFYSSIRNITAIMTRLCYDITAKLCLRLKDHTSDRKSVV